MIKKFFLFSSIVVMFDLYAMEGEMVSATVIRTYENDESPSLLAKPETDIYEKRSNFIGEVAYNNDLGDETKRKNLNKSLEDAKRYLDHIYQNKYTSGTDDAEEITKFKRAVALFDFQLRLKHENKINLCKLYWPKEVNDKKDSMVASYKKTLEGRQEILRERCNKIKPLSYSSFTGAAISWITALVYQYGYNPIQALSAKSCAWAASVLTAVGIGTVITVKHYEKVLKRDDIAYYYAENHFSDEAVIEALAKEEEAR